MAIEKGWAISEDGVVLQKPALFFPAWYIFFFFATDVNVCNPSVPHIVLQMLWHAYTCCPMALRALFTDGTQFLPSQQFLLPPLHHYCCFCRLLAWVKVDFVIMGL